MSKLTYVWGCIQPLNESSAYSSIGSYTLGDFVVLIYTLTFVFQILAPFATRAPLPIFPGRQCQYSSDLSNKVDPVRPMWCL